MNRALFHMKSREKHMNRDQIYLKPPEKQMERRRFAWIPARNT